jgi:hypothetical protein
VLTLNKLQPEHKEAAKTGISDSDKGLMVSVKGFSAMVIFKLSKNAPVVVNCVYRCVKEVMKLRYGHGLNYFHKRLQG